MMRQPLSVAIRTRALQCLATLLLGLLLAVPALAAPPEPPLWKVTGNGNAVYLLGSFHMLRPGDYPLAAPVLAALDDSQEVLFELSPGEAGSPRLGAMMLQAAQRRRAGSLEQDLGPSLWSRLQDHARASGLPLQQFAAFEPWFLGLTVGLAELQRQGFDPALGLDRQFMEAAAQAGKRTGGLETAASQIGALASLPPDVQVQMLEQALDQAEAGPEQVEAMYAAWRRGDVDRLWRGMGEELRREHPAVYRSINVDRNEAWLPQVERRLQAGEGNVLVVVGALHLVGSDGLPARLQARGYRVEQVCGPCRAP